MRVRDLDTYQQPGEQRRMTGADGRKIVDTIIRELWRDNALGTSAEIAFFFSFAIPPLLVLLVMLAALVNQQTDVGLVDGLRNLVDKNAPPETKDLFNSLIERALAKVNGGVASFGVITAAAISLWSISNAIAALIRVSNVAYGVKDDRSFIQRRLLSFGLAVVVAITMNAAIILFFFGGYLGRFLTDQFGLGRAFTITWELARWPLAVVFIVAQLAVLYYFLPNVEQSFRWASTGSLVATLVWIAGAGAFLLYLQLSNPNSIYGVFGSLLMLLGFLFMTGFAFLLGAEVNAILAREYDPEAGADLRQNPSKSTETKEISRGIQPG